MEFTQEHEGIRRGVKKFIDTEINPHVDEWEEAGIFPAHELFKKMGDQGYLGINKPTKYGGMGLDYSYQLVFLETLGHITLRRRADGDRRADRHGDAGALPLRLRGAVQGVPRALDQGRVRRLPRRVGGRRRLRRRLHQDHARRRTATTTSSTAARCGPPAARRPTGCACSPTPSDGPGAQEQVADLPADEDQGRADRAQARQARHALLRHRADLLRGRARAAALSHRQGGRGLHLPDAAVPGGAAVRGRRRPRSPRSA